MSAEPLRRCHRCGFSAYLNRPCQVCDLFVKSRGG